MHLPEKVHKIRPSVLAALWHLNTPMLLPMDKLPEVNGLINLMPTQERGFQHLASIHRHRQGDTAMIQFLHISVVAQSKRKALREHLQLPL